MDFLQRLPRYWPDFADHKPFLYRFMKENDRGLLELYFKVFGSRRIRENLDFIKEAATHDGFVFFVENLPMELRTDPALLKVAVENVPDAALRKFLWAVPPEARERHEFILFHALEWPTVNFECNVVPSSLWGRRAFVIKWSEKLRVPLSDLPGEFQNDRELCLSLYQNKFGRDYFDSFDILWIPESLRADKDFVLQCLNMHPEIFEYCDVKLQADFDVRLEAAVASMLNTDSFDRFFHLLGEQFFVSFAQMVHSRIQPHDVFMTFLASLWKARQISIQPLCTLDCDEETTRGLTTRIAEYLGFDQIDPRMMRLKRVWDEIVVMVIERKTLAVILMPLVCRQSLVKGVLSAIERKREVELRLFPQELWTNRLFVLWAAEKGEFHKCIPVEFSGDEDICLAYYQHSPDGIFPWICNSLKSNRAFVMDCAASDPLILNHCRMYGIEHDFELLLHAVYHAATDARLDGLVETAYVGGWADELTEFSKTVRAKMEAPNALKFFEAEAKSRSIAFIGLANAKILIESYLGIVTDWRELCQLQLVWSFHSIFFLAIGGCVEDLCRANKFRPQQQLTTYHQEHDDDSCHY